MEQDNISILVSVIFGAGGVAGFVRLFVWLQKRIEEDNTRLRHESKALEEENDKLRKRVGHLEAQLAYCESMVKDARRKGFINGNS